MEASTQQVMPTNFTMSTVHAPMRTRTASVADVPPACTQRQPQSPIFIGDSDDDFPIEDITASTPALFSTPPASGVHESLLATPTFGARPPLHPQTLFRTSVVVCLKRLALRPNTKNVLKNMDYASVPHRIVDFPPYTMVTSSSSCHPLLLEPRPRRPRACRAWTKSTMGTVGALRRLRTSQMTWA